MTDYSNDTAIDQYDRGEILELTAGIVSAYIGNNPVQSSDLTTLIRDIHGVMRDLSKDRAAHVNTEPAVSIKKSITDEFLICLEDGKKFKSLKRHLRSKYDLTPQQYREKWGLPHDYPMVAPSYARKRSSLAKEMGLGRGK